MRRCSIIFALSLSFLAAPVMALGQMKAIAVVAEEALYGFFYPSGRQIEKIKLGKLIKMNASQSEYLVEADVVAQSAMTGGMIKYNCGVFIKKIKNKWEEQHTECEPVTSVSH